MSELKHLNLHADYLEYPMSNFSKLLSTAEEELAGVDFDTLVGIGLSGALVVPRLAEHLGVHWLLCRKDGDGTHSWNPHAEGKLGRAWIFCDDLISSGTTRDVVRRKVRSCAEIADGFDDFKTQYLGDYLYSSGHFYPGGTYKMGAVFKGNPAGRRA